MLTLIKRWLGWEQESNTHSSGRGSVRGRPGSATSHLFGKDSPAMRKTSNTGKFRAGGAATGPKPSARAKDDFDPYNTGKFDRGASWEKISKNQR